MSPDATLHNPAPRYLRELLERSGLTQEAAAQRLGITGRALRNYLSESDPREAPYLVQFGLECLPAKVKP